METASKVLYTIASFFNYVLVVLGIIGIVFSILDMTGVYASNLGPTLWAYIWLVVAALVLISLTRIAKNRHSSRGWDVLFMILGIVSGNLFYFFGGLFGVLAIRR